MDGMNRSGITPLEFNVLIEVEKVEERTKGGLILPQTEAERMQWAETRGRIIAKSPAAFEDFPPVDVGSTVIFAKHVGMLVKGEDGNEYKLVKDKDILAVVSS